MSIHKHARTSLNPTPESRSPEPPGGGLTLPNSLIQEMMGQQQSEGTDAERIDIVERFGTGVRGVGGGTRGKGTGRG